MFLSLGNVFLYLITIFFEGRGVEKSWRVKLTFNGFRPNKTADNVILRAENDNLKNENFRLQAAIHNVICPNCGGLAILGEISLDEQHLRLENARLKDELDYLSCLMEHEKPMALDLVFSLGVEPMRIFFIYF